MNFSAEFNDSDDEASDLVDPQYFSYRYRLVGTLFISIVFIVGVLGNAMVVLVVTRVRALHSPTNCYLLSLAVADTVVLLAAVPNEILSYYLVGNQWIWGDVGCALFIFCQNLGINASSLSLVAFTVERYIAICHPMKAHKICTRGHAERITLIVWCFATLYCSPWLGLTKTELLNYRGYPGVKSCVFRLPRNKYLMYFFTDLVMFYVVPLILSCIFYTLISLALMSRPIVSVKDAKNTYLDRSSAQSKTKASYTDYSSGDTVAMVEPRHQPSAPTGRFSGVKEPLIRNWDRNKARMESIYQTPIRDFRQTAAQFGVPLSAADLTTTEKGVPKMECTTTTKSDYCAPSLDRYLTVSGVCPGKDYPSSSGLEYCPGREPEKKAVEQPISSPTMPLSKSTCPSSSSSMVPKAGPVPQLKYPPTLPQYSTARENELQLTQPFRNKNPGPKGVESMRPDYSPNVDYSSAEPEFNWPIPTDQPKSRPIQGKYLNDALLKEEVGYENVRNTPPRDCSPQFQEGGKESQRTHFDYNVETDDHDEKRQLHDISIEKARRDYEKMIGIPGSTVPLVKAGADPPNAVAHYNVPDYTQGSPAGGIIRQKFGAPNWEMNIPITDPSYPKPVNKVPSPEPGLTKMGYTGTDDVGMGKAGVTYTPPIRFPDKIYDPPGYSNAEPFLPPPPMGGLNLPDRYSPGLMEAHAYSMNTCRQQTTGPVIENTGHAQPTIDSTEKNGTIPKVEPPSLKGIRRIQTSNQVYGSWIDDPYLKDNDWWFKVRPIKNLKQTYLSKYREESGWL